MLWMAKMRDQGLAEGIAKGRAEGEAKGRAEGKVEGKKQGLRIVILAFVQKRFPSLIEQAQQKVSRMTTVGELNELYLELIGVTDEPAARQLFTS